MFENTKPIKAAQSVRFSENAENESVRGEKGLGKASEQESEALRTLAWSELSARLSAARDLRILLRRDAKSHSAQGGGSFADAAAEYFRTRNDNEDGYKPPVNPVGLEHFKGSPGKVRKDKEKNQGPYENGADDPGLLKRGTANGSENDSVHDPEYGDARDY